MLDRCGTPLKIISENIISVPNLRSNSTLLNDSISDQKKSNKYYIPK